MVPFVTFSSLLTKNFVCFNVLDPIEFSVGIGGADDDGVVGGADDDGVVGGADDDDGVGGADDDGVVGGVDDVDCGVGG